MAKRIKKTDNKHKIKFIRVEHDDVLDISHEDEGAKYHILGILPAKKGVAAYLVYAVHPGKRGPVKRS